jgi:uncharacterized membrane protein YkoI
MRTLTKAAIWAALCFGSAFAQKKLTLKDLPPAVQRTVQEQLKGGEIKGIGQEREGGVTQYEVESILNGKHRDFNVDVNGKLLVMEEETSIDSIPVAAKDAIQKKVGTGKLRMVETLTDDGQMFYEAAYTTKAGKKAEIIVKPDGTLKK